MTRYVFAAAVCALCVAPAAADVYLYVDSAPNLYGSPDWGPWWDDARADVAAGAFANMRSGHLGTPGALNAHPYDEIAYETGDRGHRLHWIYWLGGQTTSGLNGKFQVRRVADWGGNIWEEDWKQPSGWEDYGGGVIGSFHFARSAIDDYAPPYDTGGSSGDEADQADIDALADMIMCRQEFARGEVRLWDDGAGDWGSPQGLTVRIVAVPAPAAVLLAALGLGAAGLKLRQYV